MAMAMAIFIGKKAKTGIRILLSPNPEKRVSPDATSVVKHTSI